MAKLLIAAVLATLAGPASAQRGPAYDPELDARIAASIPSGREVESFAPMLDRMTGALLDVDVGPVLDAADPYRRHRGPRTLGDLAGRDDPYFEQRLRGSIYGTASTMGRMMDAFAAAAPAMARAVSEMELAMAGALQELPPPEDEPYYDEEFDEPYED